MWSLTKILAGFITINSLISELSGCLDPSIKTACDNIFSNDAMQYSCCDAMNEFVSNIQACHQEIGTDELTCDVAKCVTEEKYQISSNGVINVTRVNALLDRLDAEQPATREENQKIREECVANEGFRRYVTYDPDCEVMIYLTCAYVSYLQKCPQFNSSPNMCPQLTQDVNTCDPNLDEYLEEKTSPGCN